MFRKNYVPGNPCNKERSLTEDILKVLEIFHKELEEYKKLNINETLESKIQANLHLLNQSVINKDINQIKNSTTTLPQLTYKNDKFIQSIDLIGFFFKLNLFYYLIKFLFKILLKFRKIK